MGLNAYDAVVLEAVALAEAILHVRGPELIVGLDIDRPDYDEDEVIVDPFKLGRMRIVERLKATATPHLATVASEKADFASCPI